MKSKMVKKNKIYIIGMNKIIFYILIHKVALYRYITFKLILMIPVRMEALLNCTDEKISIRSENSL